MSDYNQQPVNNPNQQYNQNQQYPQYQPPPPPPPMQQQYPIVPQWPHMKIGQWMVTKLVLLIPFVGIIMVFIWAFGSNVNPSKKTYFQAELIWSLIMTAIFILIMVAVGSVVTSLFTDLYYYF